MEIKGGIHQYWRENGLGIGYEKMGVYSHVQTSGGGANLQVPWPSVKEGRRNCYNILYLYAFCDVIIFLGDRY